MSLNTILATAPLTATGYHLKATGTALGQSLIWDNGTNVGIGNTNTSYTLDVSGTGRFTSTLLVTGAATFSSSVGVGGATNTLGFLEVWKSGGAIAQFSIGQNATYHTDFFVDTTGNFYVQPQGTTRLTIASTGAATFSSTISAGVITGDSNSTGVPSIVAKVGSGGNNGTFGFGNSSAYIIRGGSDYGAMIFDTASTERMRITSGGFTKASNDGSYISSTGAYHELSSNASDMVSYIKNSNATPFGIEVTFTAATPNNTSNTFFIGRDSTTARFRLYSNGGLANFQANNVNLSDERTKKDIIPLESYWDKFKAIEIVKFKYIDQTHDDFNIGVIAQQVESVAPEFIDVDGFGETPEDGIPLKTVYTSDLHHTTIKVLQEAMTKIETLEATITSLQEQINELKNK